MWILTLLLFIFILGIIVLVHEFGHFIWAKHFKVHIYEFSIGMGPVIFTHKGKDKIDYNIRAFPIGGFVSMAGEVYEDDKKIKKESLMCNKPWYARLIILVAGVVNNFILAIVLLFFIALIWGSSSTKPTINAVMEGSPAAKAGLKAGDTITKINNTKVSSQEATQILLLYKSKGNTYNIEVKHSNNTKSTYSIKPEQKYDEDLKMKRNVFGIEFKYTTQKGFVNSIKYAFNKFKGVIDSMIYTLKGLFTGKISINALSGPVGIYKVVDEGSKLGIANIIYIIAFLSMNVGLINILPFPAFDGGRVLFLIIEKIKGSPVNSKIENAFHTVGFILLILLMIYITFRDVAKLFI